MFRCFCCVCVCVSFAICCRLVVVIVVCISTSHISQLTQNVYTWKWHSVWHTGNYFSSELHIKYRTNEPGIQAIIGILQYVLQFFHSYRFFFFANLMTVFIIFQLIMGGGFSYISRMHYNVTNQPFGSTKTFTHTHTHMRTYMNKWALCEYLNSIL